MKTKANTKKEVFKSASGKLFSSREEYLTTKLKSPKSKFTILYNLIVPLIKKGVKEKVITFSKEKSFTELKYSYTAPSLPLALLKALGKVGEDYRIKNKIIKEVTKSDSTGNKTSGLVEFTLIKK